MDGIFVTGTDTEVGKTIVSGGLLRLLHGFRRVSYWKPIQTGTLHGDDTQDLQSLTGLPRSLFEEPLFRFPDPLSPHLAAKAWKKTIELENLKGELREHINRAEILIVEGAGGLLVPLNQKTLQIEWISETGFPALLVAENRLGAINQVLLSLEALRKRGIRTLGVILMKGSERWGNAETIEAFGEVPILANIPNLRDGRSAIDQITAAPLLRKLFELPQIPL